MIIEIYIDIHISMKQSVKQKKTDESFVLHSESCLLIRSTPRNEVFLGEKQVVGFKEKKREGNCLYINILQIRIFKSRLSEILLTCFG